MKVKSGFSQYAKSRIPLNHPKPAWTPPPKTKENTDPSLGKLLPNGFRVGDRVYYVDYAGNNIYGTVVDCDTHHFAVQTHNVWAKWEGSPLNEIGYMPLNQVFLA